MPLLIVALVLFVILDIAIRMIVRRMQDEKQRKLREEALAVSLRMDYSREAKTLKRVEVPAPKARILCVDDETVILDSFRKILVIDGYNVDTVETGQEALGLVQAHHYDFVFTDLKMPAMDGVDVVKSVKEMRPDMDVIVITGYATVESAVECMKFGAMDYIQKPFTEEELLNFTRKTLIKRQDRIQKQLMPKVHITHVHGAEQFMTKEFTIPGGMFIARNHCWVSMETEGDVKVGMDDFAKKLIGKIDGFEFPNRGMNIQVGQPLFSVKQGNRIIHFKSPVSGKVTEINHALVKDPDRILVTPYDNNWICIIDPDRVDDDIRHLKIGKSAVQFYQEDLQNYQNEVKTMVKGNGHGKPGDIYTGEMQQLEDKDWALVTGHFFERELVS